jgi:hypothetical protein
MRKYSHAQIIAKMKKIDYLALLVAKMTDLSQL